MDVGSLICIHTCVGVNAADMDTDTAEWISLHGYYTRTGYTHQYLPYMPITCYELDKCQLCTMM